MNSIKTNPLFKIIKTGSSVLELFTFYSGVLISLASLYRVLTEI
jgi:hypothetical protein